MVTKNQEYLLNNILDWQWQDVNYLTGFDKNDISSMTEEDAELIFSTLETLNDEKSTLLDDLGDFQDEAWALRVHLHNESDRTIFERDLKDLRIEDLTDLLEWFNNIVVNWESFEVEGKEFLVLSDERADELAEEYVRNFVEDELLYHMPNNVKNYFDTEGYIEDVLRMDGRGMQLASYDHQEHEVRIARSDYFIFRTN